MNSIHIAAILEALLAAGVFNVALGGRIGARIGRWAAARHSGGRRSSLAVTAAGVVAGFVAMHAGALGVFLLAYAAGAAL